MSEQKGKVAALVLNLGGAPYGWHTVEGIGLVHPVIAVPHHNAVEFTEAWEAANADRKKEWDAFERKQERAHEQPGATHGPLRLHGRFPFVAPVCPVRLVLVTQAKADAGLEAHAEALAVVRGSIGRAVRSGDDTEKALALNERAALAGQGE